MEPDSFAFLSALVINFVDQVGISFTLPVIVPYGRFIGASISMIAFFSTVRGIGGIIAALWMPRLSDKQGRKLVLLLALLGRSLGYAIQGSASWSRDNALLIFMAGRGLAGLFSASTPVINAYITEISGANKDVLSRRMVISQVASQLAGIALQPISGSLATFSLQLPFFVCSSVGLLGLLWTCCVFREANAIKALSNSEQEATPSIAVQTTPRESPTSQDTDQEGNPLFDIVILLCMVGLFSISIASVSIPFLTSILLARESFGLQRDTIEATQGEVAMAQSLVAVPKGLCNIFVMLCLYLPVTTRCGIGPVLVVAGSISAVTYATIGYWVRDLWQLTAIFMIGGSCFGFLFPAVSPLIGRYSSVHYPKKLALCQAIPMVGSQISSTIGQNIMAFVSDTAGHRYCWVICGACMLLFTILLTAAVVLVERRAPRPSELTSEQCKMLLQAGGEHALHPAEDTDEFIESMCKHVRETLTARRAEVWNGTAQFLYRESMQRSLQSKFRAWDEDTQGQEYLEDMYALLRRGYPVELEEFCRKFPHIAQHDANTASFVAGNSFASELPLSQSYLETKTGSYKTGSYRVRSRALTSPRGGEAELRQSLHPSWHRSYSS